MVASLQVSWRRQRMLVWPNKSSHETSHAMRKVLTSLAAAATIAAVATPAAADGIRRPWRGSASTVGAISRNVITPYYVGYYGGHYSYFAPDPVYPVYPRQCWFWGYGYPYRVC